MEAPIDQEGRNCEHRPVSHLLLDDPKYCWLHFRFWWFLTNNHRSSHRRCSVRKGVLRNSAKFSGKHLCQSLFFNKVTFFKLTLLKKRVLCTCFPVNFAKCFRAPFLQNDIPVPFLTCIAKLVGVTTSWFLWSS